MDYIGTMDAFIPGQDFELYAKSMQQYFSVNNIEENQKVPLFLLLIGSETYDILKTLTKPGNPCNKTYIELENILLKYFKMTSNIIVERYKFFKAEQGPQQSVKDYIIVLKKLADACRFKESLYENLRDKFISSLNNQEITIALLKEQDLTWEKACLIATNMDELLEETIPEKADLDFTALRTYWNKFGRTIQVFNEDDKNRIINEEHKCSENVESTIQKKQIYTKGNNKKKYFSYQKYKSCNGEILLMDEVIKSISNKVNTKPIMENSRMKCYSNPINNFD